MGGKRRFFAVCGDMLRLYTKHNIPRASAGLSYFLMLSVFPTLICLYYMMGSLFPAPEDIRALLSGILPRGATDTIMDYLGYISANISDTMTWMAVVVVVTSSSAAYRTIDRVMWELRGRGRYTGALEFLFSLGFSVVFLAAMYFAAVLLLTGKWFLELADRHIMFMNISDAWSWGRFLLLFLLAFALLLMVYRLTAPRDVSFRLLPGAFGAAVALVAVSIVFSSFIGQSVRYPLIYGSLASVMILLLWLYVCGNIIFLGNILNVALERNGE